MGEIFLSYANEERALAGRFAAVLEDIGWKVWWKREIPPGSRYQEVIEKRLTGADCVLVLWTRLSADAPYVHLEAQEGRRRGTLLQVVLRECVVPLEFRHLPLRDLQGWPHLRVENALEQLVREISRLAGPPPPARATPASPPALELAGDLVLEEDFQEPGRVSRAAVAFWLLVSTLLGLWPAALGVLGLWQEPALPMQAGWVNALGVIPLVTLALALVCSVPVRWSGAGVVIAHLANVGLLAERYADPQTAVSETGWIALVAVANLILVGLIGYYMRRRKRDEV